MNIQKNLFLCVFLFVVSVLLLGSCNKTDLDICEEQVSGDVLPLRFVGNIYHHFTRENIFDVEMSFMDQFGGSSILFRDTFQTGSQAGFDYLYCRNLDSMLFYVNAYGSDSSKLNQTIRIIDTDYVHLYTRYQDQRYPDFVRAKYEQGEPIDLFVLPSGNLTIDFSKVFFDGPNDGGLGVRIKLLDDTTTFNKGFSRGYSWVVGREFSQEVPANYDLSVSWSVSEIIAPDSARIRYSGKETIRLDWNQSLTLSLMP